MSAFETITPAIGGVPGTAAQIWSASTANTLAQITAPAYLNDLGTKVKAGDYFFIQYNDTSVQPLGEAATSGQFRAQLNGTSLSLVADATIRGNAQLANTGAHVGTFANPGGSATFTVTDARVTAASVVKGDFAVSANAVNVQKITPAAGSFVVLCSGDPGVSTFNYENIVPSITLKNSGINAVQSANAGGSATTAITDASVTATTQVVGNWDTSANAVNINKITASANTITVLSSGDPGASIFSYLAITPSVTLQANGLYSTQFTYAGGAASFVITDANITANSKVTANFQSSANAVIIQKVTPGAGILTILCSANPGASVVTYVSGSGVF